MSERPVIDSPRRLLAAVTDTPAVRALARQLGTTESTLRRRLRAFGLRHASQDDDPADWPGDTQLAAVTATVLAELEADWPRITEHVDYHGDPARLRACWLAISPVLGGRRKEWGEDAVRLWHLGLSHADIAARVGMSLAAVSALLQKLGLLTHPALDDDEDALVCRLTSHLSVPAIAAATGRSQPAIRAAQARHGVTPLTPESPRLVCIDVFTPAWLRRSSWVLGFVLADGCVRRDGNGGLLEVTQRDGQRILTRVAAAFGVAIPGIDWIGRMARIRLRLSADQLRAWEAITGLPPGPKSSSIDVPPIYLTDPTLHGCLPDLWRGLIDGDGWVNTGLGLASNSPAILHDLAAWAAFECQPHLTTKPIEARPSDPRQRAVRYGRTPAAMIADLLWQDLDQHDALPKKARAAALLRRTASQAPDPRVYPGGQPMTAMREWGDAHTSSSAPLSRHRIAQLEGVATYRGIRWDLGPTRRRGGGTAPWLTLPWTPPPWVPHPLIPVRAPRDGRQFDRSRLREVIHDRRDRWVDRISDGVSCLVLAREDDVPAFVIRGNARRLGLLLGPDEPAA